MFCTSAPIALSRLDWETVPIARTCMQSISVKASRQASKVLVSCLVPPQSAGQARERVKCALVRLRGGAALGPTGCGHDYADVQKPECFLVSFLVVFRSFRVPFSSLSLSLRGDRVQVSRYFLVGRVDPHCVPSPNSLTPSFTGPFFLCFSLFCFSFPQILFLHYTGGSCSLCILHSLLPPVALSRTSFLLIATAAADIRNGRRASQ